MCRAAENHWLFGLKCNRCGGQCQCKIQIDIYCAHIWWACVYATWTMTLCFMNAQHKHRHCYIYLPMPTIFFFQWNSIRAGGAIMAPRICLSSAPKQSQRKTHINHSRIGKVVLLLSFFTFRYDRPLRNSLKLIKLAQMAEPALEINVRLQLHLNLILLNTIEIWNRRSRIDALPSERASIRNRSTHFGLCEPSN